MMVSFPDPHHPFTPPGRYWGRHRADQVTLPRSFHARASNADGVVQWARRIGDEKGFNPDATMVFLPVDERQAKEAIALTCDMIAMIDDAVGAIAAKLAALDRDRDTVILFTADHGDFLADHGLLLKGPLHLASIVRVPFIWRDPERLQDWIGELSKSDPVVVFCAYGFHIGCRTAVALREAGFDAKFMKGGHSGWKAMGGPTKMYG